MAKILGNIEDPVVPLERSFWGHPLAGLLWERQFGEVLLELGWEEVPTWECLFVHIRKGPFLSVYVDDIKMAGKKHKLCLMRKILMKNVDLQKSLQRFLFKFTWIVLNAKLKQNNSLIDDYMKMCESRTSAGPTILGKRITENRVAEEILFLNEEKT